METFDTKQYNRDSFENVPLLQRQASCHQKNCAEKGFRRFLFKFQGKIFCSTQTCNDFQNQRLPPPCHSRRAHCCNYILAPKVIPYQHGFLVAIIIIFIICLEIMPSITFYSVYSISSFDKDNMQPLVDCIC